MAIRVPLILARGVPPLLRGIHAIRPAVGGANRRLRPFPRCGGGARVRRGGPLDLARAGLPPRAALRRRRALVLLVGLLEPTGSVGVIRHYCVLSSSMGC